jgi:secernin
MCDTLCVRHDAGMWFAKNSDRHPDEVQLVEWHDRRSPGAALRTQYLTVPDAGAHAFLGSRPAWLWGCEHGVNEHGVAVGNQKIFTSDDPRRLPPALLGMDVVRLALERARSAADALVVCTSMIEQYGQGGSGEPHRDEPYFSSFLVTDAREGWIIETSDRTWVARPVGSGASISNRVSMTTNWTAASVDVAPGSNFDARRHPKAPTERSDHRLATTAACVARGSGTTLAAIATTLRDHTDNGSGYSVCMHRPESHARTTASMIVDLRADGAPTRAWTCLGNPCVGVYVPVFPPAVAPELATPELWTRFTALTNADEARAVLDPLESELWAAADDAYASGDRARMTNFARGAGQRVDEALRRLGV